MEENIVEIKLMINSYNNGVFVKVKKLQHNPRTERNIVKNFKKMIQFDNEKVVKKLEREYLGALHWKSRNRKRVNRKRRC